ncbi:hypothetical protein SCALM49S_00949 [Streptomyces californicus]
MHHGITRRRRGERLPRTRRSLRRQILEDLRGGELAAGEIASRFPISAPSISRHLGVLKGAGLVTERRDANRILYRLPRRGAARHVRGPLPERRVPRTDRAPPRSGAPPRKVRPRDPVRLSSTIERRLLVNYRVAPYVAAALLPAPLRPQLVRVPSGGRDPPARSDPASAAGRRVAVARARRPTATRSGSYKSSRPSTEGWERADQPPRKARRPRVSGSSRRRRSRQASPPYRRRPTGAASEPDGRWEGGARGRVRRCSRPGAEVEQGDAGRRGHGGQAGRCRPAERVPHSGGAEIVRTPPPSGATMTTARPSFPHPDPEALP